MERVNPVKGGSDKVAMIFQADFGPCSVRKSLQQDIFDLAPRLREADTIELRHWGSDPRKALMDSLLNAKICLSLKDSKGKTAAMFGVGWTSSPRIGRIWFLSSDDLYQISRLFLRESPRFTEYFMKGHDVLFNQVHDRNIISARWLRWLGFEPTRNLLEVGQNKASFIEFCLFRSLQVRDIYLNQTWPYFECPPD